MLQRQDTHWPRWPGLRYPQLMSSRAFVCVLLAVAFGASVGCKRGEPPVPAPAPPAPPVPAPAPPAPPVEQKRTAGQDCAKPQDCAIGLTCYEVTNTCLTPSDVQANKDCKASTQCWDDGLCTFKDGTCVAMSNKACKASSGCFRDGLCTAKDGECILASDADCSLTVRCLNIGRCTFKDGACVAMFNKDCAASNWCSNSDCIVQDGRCIVTRSRMAPVGW